LARAARRDRQRRRGRRLGQALDAGSGLDRDRAGRLAGLRAADAATAATAFQSARDGSTACAEATGAATSFRDAGQAAQADRWQATADSACAALQPDIDRTLARISDSLAAAE